MNAVSYHFHVPTEHPFSGRRRDAELHLIHVFEETNPDWLQSVHGYLFSIDEYDRTVSQEDAITINEFYDSMNFDAQYYEDVGIVPDNVKFAPFMDVMDFNDRYVYIGSKMKPPCQVLVSWHVTRDLYPIDSKYVNQMHAMIAANKEELRAT